MAFEKLGLLFQAQRFSLSKTTTNFSQIIGQPQGLLHLDLILSDLASQHLTETETHKSGQKQGNVFLFYQYNNSSSDKSSCNTNANYISGSYRQPLALNTYLYLSCTNHNAQGFFTLRVHSKRKGEIMESGSWAKFRSLSTTK